ncbi:MAG: type II toxin-antitoxin system HicB family antitoxin [Clostridium sp.]|nr:type II toxin-antitoxin system HicB family antitoxin [Clostridium sp.]
MKKDDIYIYPSIFSFDDDGISVEFPDLEGCFTCGDTTQEAITNAKEAMGLHLFGMEEDNEIIPAPTDIKNIKIKDNQSIVLIEVYMPIIREAINNQSVKKTLTIPRWLNNLAEKNNINFSQLLQSALKDILNVPRTQK